MSFKTADMPAISSAKVVSKTDAEILAAEEAEKERIRKMQGRKSTILTSGQGDTGSTSVQKKTLLGE
jgi:hypothetical protein